MEAGRLAKQSHEKLEELQAVREHAKTLEERVKAQKAIDDFFLKNEKNGEKKEKKKKIKIETEEDLYYY